ncbi:MAG: hypothetical protein WBZ48_04080 [Bacteroidota bacterium]
MSNPLELNHAKHDEEIATMLHTGKKSVQWTVIVCFYSALHYVRSKIFPLTEVSGGVTTTYNSFDDYHTRLRADGHSMHDRLVILTWRDLNSIAAKYQWLFNSSITARYNNYEPDPRASDMSMKYLLEIKKECTKK